MAKVIGGEYEISFITPLGNKRDFVNQGELYSSGRGALFFIIQSIKINQPNVKRVFIPDYICDSVVETLNIAKIPWKVYHLKDDLSIDREDLCNQNLSDSAIIVVNYFGLSLIGNEIAFIRSYFPAEIIIEDDVQSFYSMFEYSDADYRFTSFRKSLPLPDGGWALSKYRLLPAENETNTFAQYKIAGSILKSQRALEYYDDSIYLDLLEKGETLINDNITKSISNFSQKSYSYIDYEQYGALRKRNARFLIQELEQIGISPILPISDTIPLFVPICLKNRDKVRRALFSERIFCPIHWPFTDVFNDDFKLGKVMSEEELSLVVDYRYELFDIQRMVAIIKKNI